MTMTVTTQGGAVYSLEYRDLDGSGARLACRRGAEDDADRADAPMDAGRWYEVTVMRPMPPQVAARVVMVLDPVEGDADPIARRSTMVMSVVGRL